MVLSPFVLYLFLSRFHLLLSCFHVFIEYVYTHTWILLAFPWLSVSHLDLVNAVSFHSFYIYIHVCFSFLFRWLMVFLFSLRSLALLSLPKKMNTCFSVSFSVVGLFFIYIFVPSDQKKETKDIYYYFCLLFRLIFSSSASCTVHCLHIFIALRFTFYFFPFFGRCSNVYGMSKWRSSCYWLHVYCFSFVHREKNSLFLFVVVVVSCIVP